MAYTVKQIAKISGVSIRTLHFYDEIGLLKPAYHGANGYRYYEEEQLLLLQQILFFREMGMELKEIHKILNRSDFNKIAALNSHRLSLERQQERVDQQLQTIDRTINHLKGKIKMEQEEFFYGLDSPQQKEHEKYLIESGKVSASRIAEAREKLKKWTDQDWQKHREASDQLWKEFAAACAGNLDPASPEVQKLTRRQYEGIKDFWTPTKEKFLGLAQFFRDNPDFEKFFSRYHPRLMDFAIDAMNIFAQKELS